MLRSVLGYSAAFAAVAVAYGLAKTAIAGDALAVDAGLVATLAVTGAIGGFIAARRSRD